jgi:hypothetical protein
LVRHVDKHSIQYSISLISFAFINCILHNLYILHGSKPKLQKLINALPQRRHPHLIIQPTGRRHHHRPILRPLTRNHPRQRLIQYFLYKQQHRHTQILIRIRTILHGHLATHKDLDEFEGVGEALAEGLLGELRGLFFEDVVDVGLGGLDLHEEQEEVGDLVWVVGVGEEVAEDSGQAREQGLAVLDGVQPEEDAGAGEELGCHSLDVFDL